MTEHRKPTRKQVLTYLTMAPTANADELAECFGWSTRETQDLLIQMDDDGDVIMRNGIYKISARSRSEIDRRHSGG